jgi:hypothetical protein
MALTRVKASVRRHQITSVGQHPSICELDKAENHWKSFNSFSEIKDQEDRDLGPIWNPRDSRQFVAELGGIS